MTGLSALNLPQPLVWILAFAIIFGLLAAFAHLLKRIAGGRAAELEGGRNRVPRLGLVDSFDLDRQRKLMIVRRDNVEHLILVGPTDVVVESNIVRAAGAAAREERQPMSLAPTGTPLSSPSAPAASPIPPGAQAGSQRDAASALPIPPVPAVPQAMPSAQPPAPAPAMPTAPFPIPQPVRNVEPGRKSTMPPPPPFGAPKRTNQPTPQRVEPVLTAIPGGAKPSEKLTAEAPAPPKPVAEAPAAPAPAPTPPAQPEAPVEAPPKPVELSPVAEVPVTAHQQTEPTPAPASPKTDPNDPILADLSSKLQDVLKANVRPEPAAPPVPTRAPLPPLPPVPPQPAAEKLDLPIAKPAAKPAVTEIVHAPEAVPEAAPPAPPVDAFEEELRRILGRAPQKG